MFDEERVKMLLADYFDESLEGAERQELEQLVISSARAREMFWAAADQHALGREWALATMGRNVAEIVSRPHWNARWWVGLAAAAACLVMGAVVWTGSRKPMETAEVSLPAEKAEWAGKADDIPAVIPDEEGAVALLGLSSAAVWGDGLHRLTGDALPPGPLVLKSGTVRIDFYKGARGWLEGPAEVELVSPGELKLLQGAVLVRVPPAAEGFRLQSGDLIVRDFGTEFGVMAGDAEEKEVHVFEGEVEVIHAGSPGEPVRMKRGEALRSAGRKSVRIPAMKAVFPDPSAVWQQVTGRDRESFREWRAASEAFSLRPGMLVHYLFTEKNPEGRIPNMAPGADPSTDGTLIGGEWAEGRWEGKSALAFRGGNDRLRLVLPGTYEAMTWMVWLKLDERPGKLIPLWRGESYGRGCIHWNIDEFGRVRLGVRTSKDPFPANTGNPNDWDVAMSREVLGDAVGRWVHLAAVYDSRVRKVTMWKDGREIVSTRLLESIPAIQGICQIGSSYMQDGEGRPAPATAGRSKDRIGFRTLNGRIDELAVLGRALTEKEIREHFLTGRPYAGDLAEPASW
jgi:hypothetical protein